MLLTRYAVLLMKIQVEEVLNPSLRGKPIGIRQKYLLVTCNYTARNLGVRKMKSVAEVGRPYSLFFFGPSVSHRCSFDYHRLEQPQPPRAPQEDVEVRVGVVGAPLTS